MIYCDKGQTFICMMIKDNVNQLHKGLPLGKECTVKPKGSVTCLIAMKIFGYIQYIDDIETEFLADPDTEDFAINTKIVKRLYLMLF